MKRSFSRIQVLERYVSMLFYQAKKSMTSVRYIHDKLDAAIASHYKL